MTVHALDYHRQRPCSENMKLQLLAQQADSMVQLACISLSNICFYKSLTMPTKADQQAMDAEIVEHTRQFTNFCAQAQQIIAFHTSIKRNLYV